MVLPEQFFKWPPKWSIRNFFKKKIKSNQIKWEKIGGKIKEKKKQKQESQVVDLVIRINQHHGMQDDFCPNMWGLLNNSAIWTCPSFTNENGPLSFIVDTHVRHLLRFLDTISMTHLFKEFSPSWLSKYPTWT